MKLLDEICVGSRIDRGHRDGGVGQLRILPNRQLEACLRADQQDEQAHHTGKHRPLDEDIGEGHGGYRLAAPRAGVRGRELSILMVASGWSLSWPLGHHLLARLYALKDRHLVALARSNAHEAALDRELRRRHSDLADACGLLGLRWAFLHHPHAVAIEAIGDRGTWHRHQLLWLALQHADIGEHAGEQFVIGILEAPAHHERARVLRNASVEGFDLALEHLAGIAR